MSRRDTYIDTFQTYKGEQPCLFWTPESGETRAVWSLARSSEFRHIRYDFYRGKLRLDIDKYGVAINREAIARNKKRLAHIVKPWAEPTLVTDLVRVDEFALPPTETKPNLYERFCDGPSEFHVVPPALFDRADRCYEYGRILGGLLVDQEADLRDMIERCADSSEVTEYISRHSAQGKQA